MGNDLKNIPQRSASDLHDLNIYGMIVVRRAINNPWRSEMDISQERYLKPSEVCRLLRISRSKLWSLRKSGEFTPSIKLGKSERFTMADIEKLITVPK